MRETGTQTDRQTQAQTQIKEHSSTAMGRQTRTENLTQLYCNLVIQTIFYVIIIPENPLHGLWKFNPEFIVTMAFAPLLLVNV